jgi:hypothetical protein
VRDGKQQEDDDVRSICTNVPHELESVEEVDDERMAR